MNSPATVLNALERAVSRDHHREVLCALWEDYGDDGHFLVATDTHRLHFYRVTDVPVDAKSVVPIWPPFGISGITGTFPNWRRVVPEVGTIEVRVDATALGSAVQAVATTAKDNANRVILTFEQAPLGYRLIARAADASNPSGMVVAVGTVPVIGMTPNAHGFEIALNCKYLLDALPAIKRTQKGLSGSIECIIKCTESGRPITLRYENIKEKVDPKWLNFTAVIMPMAKYGSAADGALVKGLV